METVTTKNRQQIRAKERKLKKQVENIKKLQNTATKPQLFNALMAAIDPEKSPIRKGLEAAALFNIVNVGNVEHCFLYLKIVSDLPDVFLANDCTTFIFDRAIRYSIEENL